MRSKILIVVLALGATASLVAQQRETNQQLADQQQAAQKSQVRLFELVLQQAVDRGGARLADWALQIDSRFMLTPATPPIISSVPVPDSGVVFDIQIPEIIGTQFIERFARTTSPAQPQQPIQPTAGKQQLPQQPGKSVGATSTPTPDPMKAGPAAENNLSANDRYSEFVRESLIDAILDGSGVLSLKDNESLTVAAIGIDVAVTNPLYKNQSRKLILHIKGADLALYHAGKITKDEAKNRIIELRF